MRNDPDYQDKPVPYHTEDYYRNINEARADAGIRYCAFCNEPAEVEVWLEINEEQSTIANLCNDCFGQLQGSKIYCHNCGLNHPLSSMKGCQHCGQALCPRGCHDVDACREEKRREYARFPWKAEQKWKEENE